jgi:ASC-1-like (ASCH) protein
MKNKINKIFIILIMDNIKNINVSEPWFSLIKKGRKKIEGRLNKGTFSELKKGDIIMFKNDNDSCKAKITGIKHYDTFHEYLTMEGLKRTLPGIKTIEEGVNIYYKYYTKDMEKQFKILAIYIKRI